MLMTDFQIEFDLPMIDDAISPSSSVLVDRYCLDENSSYRYLP